MEAKTKYYLIIYILVLVLTFIFVRVSAHTLHDKESYNSSNLQNNEKIKTLTSLLRKTTNFDWHHIHFGIIIFLASGALMLSGFVNKSSVILISIGSSLTFDQILPLMNLGNYFSTSMILSSLLIHLICIETLLITNSS